MKRILTLLTTALAVLLLNGCLGDSLKLGSSAAPPSNLQAVAGDGSVTLTWDTAPGVEYWVFVASGSGVTTDNWDSRGGQAFPRATSPYVVPNLTNGQLYSFTVNARIDGGPGGPGAPSVNATPRMLGDTWSNVGPIPESRNLNAVTYAGDRFVVVGDQGAIYSSPDFTASPTWTSLTNPTTANLHAVDYGGVYLAAGAAGTILRSTDGTTWAKQTSGTSKTLYGLANNGANGYVAVGEIGTILSSLGGESWTSSASGTIRNLNAVIYTGSRWIAVGNAGTILISLNALNWTSISAPTTQNLNGLTLGWDATTATPMLIAVGDAGTQLTSLDNGMNWVKSTINAGFNFKAITYGSQFITVGNWGTIYTSSDGGTWTRQTSNTLSLLNAAAYSSSGNIAVVGNGGLILAAQ
ncbi:exported protein of unknown function [Sterolibacterium denitrificans]|uniref:Fibronectin type-III domain-containing protein n=1 Tax=Sterolibacterium denitrificans TaxID=157592 RepID=A0A7Z7HTA1_9PROT|nr:fibronectin type III domain-containing protein [Sterolibacterium denitrificans]SMB29694.1 exported protein of unknown function [Sterolibacterium denitrificans]